MSCDGRLSCVADGEWPSSKAVGKGVGGVAVSSWRLMCVERVGLWRRICSGYADANEGRAVVVNRKPLKEKRKRCSNER